MNENQKKVTDEYRKNYDIIFRKKQTSEECIEADKNDKASIEVDNIVSLLIGAVKEQKEQIDSLKAKAKKRKSKIAPEKKI